MLSAIEDAIITRLKDKGLDAAEIDVRRGVEGLVKPAVHITVEEGRFEKVTQIAFRQTVTVSLYIVFKHLKNESKRRKGIYAVLEGVIGILTLQALSLSIAPLKPLAFREITDEEMLAAGLVAYRIAFETSYMVEKMSETTADDLLTVGLSYYLKPGDNAVDATDEVDLPL